MRKLFLVLFFISSLFVSCETDDVVTEPQIERGYVGLTVNGEYREFATENATWEYYINGEKSGWAHTSRMYLGTRGEYDQIKLHYTYGSDKKTIEDVKVSYVIGRIDPVSLRIVATWYQYDPIKNAGDPIRFSIYDQNDQYVTGDFAGTVGGDKNIVLRNGRFKLPLFRVKGTGALQ